MQLDGVDSKTTNGRRDMTDKPKKSGNGEAVEAPTRDSIRAKIFAAENKRFKTKEITIFGADVEIRQPSLGMILKVKEDEDREKAIVRLLIDFCFVPGTDERVFNSEDGDVLLAMPFGNDLIEVNNAIEELTNIDILEQEKNSSKALTEGQ